MEVATSILFHGKNMGTEGYNREESISGRPEGWCPCGRAPGRCSAGKHRERSFLQWLRILGRNWRPEEMRTNSSKQVVDREAMGSSNEVKGSSHLVQGQRKGNRRREMSSALDKSQQAPMLVVPKNTEHTLDRVRGRGAAVHLG